MVDRALLFGAADIDVKGCWTTGLYHMESMIILLNTQRTPILIYETKDSYTSRRPKEVLEIDSTYSL